MPSEDIKFTASLFLILDLLRKLLNDNSVISEDAYSCYISGHIYTYSKTNKTPTYRAIEYINSSTSQRKAFALSLH